jgi:hypothetical protein
MEIPLLKIDNPLSDPSWEDEITVLKEDGLMPRFLDGL